MRITEIAVKMGETVNLGNYSNYRPEISVTAEVALGENPNRAIEQLTRTVQERLSGLVDEALEQAEMEPKYANRLFGIRVNRARGIVLVFKRGLNLPAAKTWRESDSWERESRLSHYMRLDTAMAAADDLECEKGLTLYLVEWQEDMGELPGLPDPGPEPLWSQKGLKEWLARIQTPDTEWDMLADLPHVTPEHIQTVYHSSPHATYDKLKDAILAAPTTSTDVDDDDLPENERFPDDEEE